METILLIEGDGARRERLAATLRQAGYTVVAVARPAEALAADAPADLLVTGTRRFRVTELLRRRNRMRVLHLAATDEPLAPEGLLRAVRAALDGPARKAVILVVDDQEPVRKLIGEFLVLAGYEFLEAENGSHAIDLVRQRQGHVDLVITDLVMPAASGLDLTADLTREYPATKILYISGYTDSVAMDVIARRSPDAVLLKPFTEQVLLTRLARLLGSA